MVESAALLVDGDCNLNCVSAVLTGSLFEFCDRTRPGRTNATQFSSRGLHCRQTSATIPISTPYLGDVGSIISAIVERNGAPDGAEPKYRRLSVRYCAFLEVVMFDLIIRHATLPDGRENQDIACGNGRI